MPSSGFLRLIVPKFEVAFGSNPNDPESFPGQPSAVPALGWVGVVLLTLLSLVGGWATASVPRRGSRR